MHIDKDRIITQDEEGESAPVDEVEERVEAEMKRLEGRAKEAVGQGLGDTELERGGREQEREAEAELRDASEKSGEKDQGDR